APGVQPRAARSSPHRRARHARYGGEALPGARVVYFLSSREPRARSHGIGARTRVQARSGRRGRHVRAHLARRVSRAPRPPMSLGPLMIDLEGSALTAEERELLRHPLVGGVLLFTRNYVEPGQLTALVAGIHAARAPALIVAVDHEGGRVQRFRGGFSLLPPARRIGHEFDADAKAGLALARQLGWLMAAGL